jgi:hypothetical protein
MVKGNNKVIIYQKIKELKDEIEKRNIRVIGAYLFGSNVNGKKMNGAILMSISNRTPLRSKNLLKITPW